MKIGRLVHVTAVRKRTQNNFFFRFSFSRIGEFRPERRNYPAVGEERQIIVLQRRRRKEKRELL